MGVGYQSPKRPSAATVNGVDQSTSAVVLLSANPDRKGALIQNSGTGWLYVKLGADATSADYSARLLPNNVFSLENPVYTGQVTGVWSQTGSGEARVTEIL